MIKRHSFKLLIASAMLCSFSTLAAADEMGIEIIGGNGGCVAGTCPATGPVTAGEVSLPYSGIFKLGNGDEFQIDVNLTETFNAPTTKTSRDISVKYIGNSINGNVQSQGDEFLINIYRAYATTAASYRVTSSFTGSFENAISTDRVSNEIFDELTGKVANNFGVFSGPNPFATAATSFSLTTNGQIASSMSRLVYQFGAGSAVGATINVTSVPEPATAALLCLGLVGIGFASRNRKAK